MTALVSVIIPCRNAEPWLGDAIESCLRQTWPRVQIIVVDDGSTDRSMEVAARYAGRGVEVFECGRRSAAAARNTGLEHARGDFIQFLDADDLLGRDKIRVQAARLAASPPGTMASGAWARFREAADDAVFAPEPVWRDLAPQEFLIRSWLGGGMMPNFAWLTPRALIDRAGPWNESLSINDDGEFFGRVMLAASGIVFCGDARGYYRSGAGASLSGRRDHAALRSAYAAIELSSGHLLARSQSAEARSACAAQYRRFAYDAYPDASDLVLRAERRVAELGGSALQPGGGRAFQLLARGFGWKFGRRCQRVWRRLQGVAAAAPL